jgi:hypothetical protein
MLADRAGVAPITVKRLEGSEGTLAAHVRTVEAVRAALEEAGVVFLDPQEGARHGVCLRTWSE